MQCFTVFTLILIWRVNKLQCSDRVNNITGHLAKLIVTPKPAEGAGIKPVVLGKEAEPLNLTCQIVYQKTERNDIPSSREVTLPVYVVDWKVLHPNDNRLVINGNLIYTESRFERGQDVNSAWLWFERLAETDAGDYSCQAISRNASRQRSVSTDIHLTVKNKVGTCGPNWFRCPSTRCIRLRYLCDGMADCEHGEDESSIAGCGPDPCFGKIYCGERCMPRSLCCDLGNCNTSLPAVRLEPPGSISTEQQRLNDMGFLQTTIYTVIGCAMAFMFIVTILVIMICRVHMKRAMNSRCSQQVRNPGPRPRHSVPLYDLDLYLNRAADINNQRGVTVTYNINNGVQFVGRPVEPPPYSEIAPVPPREGPPPPYVSRENLLDSATTPNSNQDAASRGTNLNLTSPFVNTAGTATRIIPSCQNNSNSARVQCFSSGQIPASQATPGFNHFVMSRNCDDASNTTLNTSDSTVLNTSSNSDSSSNNSVSNFVICRNITSHSQNFEPEYTETDSLLIENQLEAQAPSEDRVARISENPISLIHSQKRNEVEDTIGVLKNSSSIDISLPKSELLDRQNIAEMVHNPVTNFDLGISECFLMHQTPHDTKNLKTSETEPSLLDVDYQIAISAESKCSRSIKKNKNGDSINFLGNRDIDSTLRRLSCKTVLDLSAMGESSKSNLSIGNNSAATRSLPFHLNGNPSDSFTRSDANSDEQSSSLITINPDSVESELLRDCLQTNDPVTTIVDTALYAKTSSGRKSSIDDSRKTSLSSENLAKDLKSFNDQNLECFSAYLNVKDEQMVRVPLVTDELNSVGYNELSASVTGSSASGNSTKIIDSDDNTPVREAQPLVMPLRESFIGVRRRE